MFLHFSLGCTNGAGPIIDLAMGQGWAKWVYPSKWVLVDVNLWAGRGEVVWAEWDYVHDRYVFFYARLIFLS
jgi:hypothetical protein